MSANLYSWTAERLAAIRARQMPDHDKRRRADFDLPTGLGRAFTLRRVRRIVTMLAGGPGDTKPVNRG